MRHSYREYTNIIWELKLARAAAGGNKRCRLRLHAGLSFIALDAASRRAPPGACRARGWMRLPRLRRWQCTIKEMGHLLSLLYYTNISSEHLLRPNRYVRLSWHVWLRYVGCGTHRCRRVIELLCAHQLIILRVSAARGTLTESNSRFTPGRQHARSAQIV